MDIKSHITEILGQVTDIFGNNVVNPLNTILL